MIVLERKKEIIRCIKKHIAEKSEQPLDKKSKKALAVLGAIEEEDISFGNAPQYYFAQIECNSTGVGTSSFQGTETQRTVAMDYVTDETLFIDGHEGAGRKGLELFYLKPNQTIRYYKKSDTVKAAKEYGFRLHLQKFRDLNFTLNDHRLNRYTVHITRKPFSFPIRPIHATVISKDKAVIGYIYEKDSEEYILIDPEDLLRTGEKDSGYALWILLGFFFPPILLVLGFLWLVKIQKERMIG